MAAQIDLQEQLRQLALFPSSGTAHTLRHDAGAVHFTLEITDVTRLGCELHELLVTSDTLAASSFDQVRGLADQIVQRVRYLLEPLQVQEIDRERAAVQLRSAPPENVASGDPTASNDGKKQASAASTSTVRYYEVLLERDHGLRLVRYEKPPLAARRQVPVQVSCQTLQKLCHDLVDLVGAMNAVPR